MRILIFFFNFDGSPKVLYGAWFPCPGTCDCDFSADDGVHGGPAVPDHEQELAVREEFPQVVTRLEGEGILPTNHLS